MKLLPRRATVEYKPEPSYSGAPFYRQALNVIAYPFRHKRQSLLVGAAALATAVAADFVATTPRTTDAYQAKWEQRIENIKGVAPWFKDGSVQQINEGVKEQFGTSNVGTPLNNINNVQSEPAEGQGNTAAENPPSVAQNVQSEPADNQDTTVYLTETQAKPSTPVADGIYGPEEWKGAKSIDFEWGKLLYKNDGKFLYLLIDVTGDTGNDPPAEGAFPSMDGFSIAFDVDNNRQGTPMVDKVYGISRVNIPQNPTNSYKPSRLTLLLGPPETNYLGWSAGMETVAQLGVGFGKTDDADIPHRTWELSIPFDELGIQPNKATEQEIPISVVLFSKNPEFRVGSYPNNFEGLSAIKLKF